MSLSINIVGIKKPDDKFHKMKDVFDACVNARVNVPSSVIEYFNDMKPNDNGVCVELPSHAIKKISELGREIDLNLIDKDITMIKISFD